MVVSNVLEVESRLGGTDWKAWIGRASKNSWAMKKGVLLGSEYTVRLKSQYWVANVLPFGINLRSSNQVIGRFRYLLVLL